MSKDEERSPFHRMTGEGDGAAVQFSVESIERLELAGRLVTTEKPTFSPGQLVKPRDWAPLRFKGACVVIEILLEPIRFPVQDRDTDGYLFDMRVGINCGHGHIHSCLVESWMFEPYAGLVLFGGTMTTKPPPGIA